MKTSIKTFVFSAILITNLYSQEIPYGREFQVNTYTEGPQINPTITQLRNGKIVICWESGAQQGVGTGIFGQILDTLGGKIGKEFQIDTRTTGLQYDPEVSFLKDGGFVVCWQDLSDGSYYGIFGQLFDESGTKRGQEFIINSYANKNQIFPAVIGLQEGTFIVCWESWGGFHSGWGICGQLFNPSGYKIGNEFRVDSYDLDQQNPAGSALKDGGFVVCWQTEYQDGSKLGVFGQLFDSSGRKKGNTFQINTYTALDQWRPSITTLRNGSFVVCWTSRNQDGSDHGIFGQLYASSGAKTGKEFQVNSYINEFQISPTVSSLRDGGFIVCWESKDQDGSEIGIYGQLFDSLANKRECEFQINTYIESSQRDPVVTGLQNGGFIVCWESRNSQDGSDAGIFAKFFPQDPIIHPLREFSLITPSNDATINTTLPTFKWRQPSHFVECYSWEITFDLYIDNDFAFPNPRIIRNIKDTTYTIDSLAAGKTYFWKVLSKNLTNDSLWSKQQDWGFFISQSATSVKTSHQDHLHPFFMYQNHPNPFNQETAISFQLPTAEHTVLKIFNALGQEIKTLIDQKYEAGYHTVRWDGRDNSGNLVMSGTYLYQIKAGDFVAIKKLVVLK